MILGGMSLLSLVWLIGIYAIVLGVTLVVLAFRERGMRERGNSRVT